jgi:hypothetical protein
MMILYSIHDIEKTAIALCDSMDPANSYGNFSKHIDKLPHNRDCGAVRAEGRSTYSGLPYRTAASSGASPQRGRILDPRS